MTNNELFPFDVFSSECGHVIVYSQDIIGAATKARSVNPKLTRNKIESIRKLYADQIQILDNAPIEAIRHPYVRKFTPEDALKENE